MKLHAKTILTVGDRTVVAGEEFETDDVILIDVLLRHGWAEVVQEEKVEKQTTRRKKNEG